MLILSVISAGVVAFTALSLAKVNSIVFQGLNASRTALTVQQYAEAEAAIIKSVDYSDVVAHNRAEIQNSDGFESEVLLSGETDYNDKLKQKIATINIYKTCETLPRVSYSVLKVNTGNSGGVPIGTVITWASSKNPTEGGTWLECNGQSATAYPALVAVLGKNTVPDYRGVFLRGYGSVITSHFGNVIHQSDNLGAIQGDAIRNIYGSHGVDDRTFNGLGATGAFFKDGGQDSGSTHTFHLMLLV